MEVTPQLNQPTSPTTEPAAQKNHAYRSPLRHDVRHAATNDSSGLNDISTSNASSLRGRTHYMDTIFPRFKRSKSSKISHHHATDLIKEELNEDDNNTSFLSLRSKFSAYTYMPKENFFQFERYEKKKFFNEQNINKGSMEPVIETDDDTLFFQKKDIQFLSDFEEDSKIILPNYNIKKKEINTEDIIQEEKEMENIFDDFFEKRWDSLKKNEFFYDKEDPPKLVKNLQGECKTYLPDVITEEYFEDDAREVIKNNSYKLRQKNKIADEIDNSERKKKFSLNKAKTFEESIPSFVIDEAEELKEDEDKNNTDVIKEESDEGNENDA